MKPLPEKITRKELLALPQRQWDEEKTYDYLYIVPTGRKHNSGYGLIAIIGVLGKEGEIAAYCDDIRWSMPKSHPYNYGTSPHTNSNIMLTNMLFPSNILRMWGSGEHYFKGKFKVGVSLSSTEVELIVAPVGDGRNKVTGEVITIPYLGGISTNGRFVYIDRHR